MTTEAHTIDMRRAAFRDMPQCAGAMHETAPSLTRPSPIMAERPIGFAFFALLAVGLWIATHPYPGILGDASVYIGRALADLDPNGVGRDMMFVHDGQSRFSVFPLLLDHMVAALGTARTGLLLSMSAVALWAVTLAIFAGRYVPKSFVAIVVIFVAVLPNAYGAPQRFSFSEAIAVPRPFAEALVLLALASLAGGRMRTAFASLIAASLVHPLMALAGWGVFAIVLGREDRRWIAAFGGIALLVIAGALAGVPVLHRLVTTMDPQIKAFAVWRGPHLFPTHWPIGFMGPMLAQAATLAIAASFFAGRRRLILIAAILVGVGGIVAQAIFADQLSLLLVIQGQLWRAAWLTAALGAVALALCAREMWENGPRGHVTLALLALSWLTADMPEVAGFMAVAAVAVYFAARRTTLPLTWNVAILLWGIAILVAAGLNAHYFRGYAQFIERIPADASHGIGYFWLRRYVAFPILGAVLLLAFSRKWPRLAELGLVVAALCLCVIAIRSWDERDSFQKMLDSDRHPPELMQAIASRPGEILWVDGLGEAWYLAGRPQWASRQQGVSSIFSRELVTEWRKRMQFLVDEGLAANKALTTFHIPSWKELPRLTAANVSHLCARPDAPAWIVAPVYKDTIIPPGLAAHEWRLPQPNFRMTEEPDFYAWHRIDAYAILPCAGGPTQQR